MIGVIVQRHMELIETDGIWARRTSAEQFGDRVILKTEARRDPSIRLAGAAVLKRFIGLIGLPDSSIRNERSVEIPPQSP